MNADSTVTVEGNRQCCKSSIEARDDLLSNVVSLVKLPRIGGLLCDFRP